jgi:hypothetical protein
MMSEKESIEKRKSQIDEGGCDRFELYNYAYTDAINVTSIHLTWRTAIWRHFFVLYIGLIN